jgi:hypothetical protein
MRPAIILLFLMSIEMDEELSDNTNPRQIHDPHHDFSALHEAISVCEDPPEVNELASPLQSREIVSGGMSDNYQRSQREVDHTGERRCRKRILNLSR